MAFYEWQEDHLLISDQEGHRRNPDCCLYHNDHINTNDVAKLAEYLGDKNENGFVVSSILGAACTCDDSEHGVPYDLLKTNRTNMTYDDVLVEEDELVLFYANVCNKLKDKENELWTFFHELLVQWYKWRDPSVVHILRVITAITFKPYRDTFSIQVSPDFWKEFFSDSLQERIKSYNCDVWLHTDEELVLKNKVYFIVHAPSFIYFNNLKSSLQQRLHDITYCGKDTSQSGSECADSQTDDCISEPTPSEEPSSTSSETTTGREDEQPTENAPAENAPAENAPAENAPAENVPVQAEASSGTSNNDADSLDNAQINYATVGSLPDIGEILAPQIPELSSPKSPSVELTFADIARDFLSLES